MPFNGLGPSLRVALDALPTTNTARSLPLQPLDHTDVGLPSPPVKRSLPASPLPDTQSDSAAPLSLAERPEARPALTIQPASPALANSATFDSLNLPYPRPMPSTSAVPPVSSFQPPPLSSANGGSLAARRAAKLGKKRLSLVVPTGNPSSNGLLSPATPSFLRPGDDHDAETRSLPPSPVSLTTFIGTEGAEAPDRTIGRLMLKQQADEMREQMRGGRGMKRRTSIPRLNLAGGAAKPSHLDNLAVGAGGGSKSSRSGEGPSAVQLIRADAIERRWVGEEDVAEVEEFPYALGPREILPGIFLGSEQNAKDAAVLRNWKIGFVLNVAKEVDCPWVDETIEEEEDTSEDVLMADGDEDPHTVAPPIDTPWSAAAPIAPHPALHEPPPFALHRPSHRRTKTQAAITTLTATAEPTPARPVRPFFIRPTASTPNLHAVFNPSPPPPVPALPNLSIPAASPVPPAAPSDAMKRSLSSSPPVPRRTPPRALRRSAAPSTSTRSAGAVRIPSNCRSGRPALEYLWLKWGHDEADLVEAKKFQAAFDFLDEARERNERVLVHCQCGVSRSATVVIAYCMREAAKALEEGRDAAELAGCTGMHDTYSFVKEKSEWVGPNLSLVFQLVAYERTLRGDVLGEEDPDAYPNYPPEPFSPSDGFPTSAASPATSRPPPAAMSTDPVDYDLPPPPSTSAFGSFSFPTSQDTVSAKHPVSLSSPRTPASAASMSDSQMATPELQHSLVSPTFSNGTNASSVTSTPLSASEQGALSRSVHIVRADEDIEIGPPHRHTSLDTVVAAEEDHTRAMNGDKPFFVLPAPPQRNGTLPHDLHMPSEAPSPTVAIHPRPRPAAPRLSLSVPASPAIIAPPATAVNGSKTHCDSPSAMSPASPAFSLASPASQLASPHPSMVSSTSSTSIASIASNASTLSRSNSSARRFGASQTASQRRASHRRVFSVDNPALVAAAAAANVPAAASGRPEGEFEGR
ncbi:hypothetical protein JCM11641_007453 [Rhodosporidiobolus odoratus]